MDVTVLPSVRLFVNRMPHATVSADCYSTYRNTGIVGAFCTKSFLCNTSDIDLFCCTQSAAVVVGSVNTFCVTLIYFCTYWKSLS